MENKYRELTEKERKGNFNFTQDKLRNKNACEFCRNKDDCHYRIEECFIPAGTPTKDCHFRPSAEVESALKDDLTSFFVQFGMLIDKE